MKKALGLSILAIVLATPAGAQSTGGMAVMQYYVGTWSCMSGPIGVPPVKGTGTYTLDSGVMRQWVSVPPQGKMKKLYTLSNIITYDSKARRYVSVGLDSDSAWGVSYLKPFLPGGTEQWTDHAISSGPLGHATLVRTNRNAWVYTGYPTLTSTKPNFRVRCTRST